MDDLVKVEQLWLARGSMHPEDVLEEVATLTDPVFSARMLVKVTGLPMSRVLAAMGKTAKTGGRLNPETLPDIVKCREFFDPALVKSIVKRGTAQTLLARLLGVNQSKVSRIVNSTVKEET